MIDETVYKALRFQSTARPADLLADLAGMEGVLAFHEKKARFWKIILFCWILFVIVAAIVAMSLAPHKAPVLVPLVIIGIIGVIVFGAILYHASERIPDKLRYEIAARVLKHLACDMAPAATLNLVLDLNKYHNNSYRTHSSKSGGVAALVYQLPWLTIEGALLDGSRFRLQSTIVVNRKERAKRKYTKVKEQFGETVTLALRVKTADSAALAAWPQLLRAARLPPHVSLKKVLQEDNRLTAQVATERRLRLRDRSGTTGKDADRLRVDEHTMLMLFLACYQALHQCRAQRKGA